MASPQLSFFSKKKLRDGNEIPIVGFGTYEVDGRDAYNAVTMALEAGYCHIDSAEWYYNETECGRAILDFCSKTGTPRSSIFFTTKLKQNSGYAHAKKAIQRSLDKCGLGYIDLYLIHGPIGGPKARKESWRAICEAKEEGKLKSIGVSNFGVRHMKELVEGGEAEAPAVNQMELHPFNAHQYVVEYCERHGIALEAWAPLVRALKFRHPTIVLLAEKYNKSPAQVLLRYSIQKGYIPLPKSVSKERIISNTQVFDPGFELTAKEMETLWKLDEGLVTDWDPSDCP